MLLFGFMASMLLLGMLLRAKIKFFQVFLIPSCFLGGIVGLVLISMKVVNASTSLLETFAYHLFNISCISIGLTASEEQTNQTVEGNPIKGPLWMAIVSGVTMSLQGIVGGGFVLLFNEFGSGLYSTFGFLAPLGFTQGPGQALSIGKVWEEFGFQHAATIGLTFATLGFVFAFFFGVPLVNYGIRKGYSTNSPSGLSRDVMTGVIGKDGKKESAGELTIHSGNADTLAFHAALIGLVYLVTYLFVWIIGHLFSPDVAKSLWGFFFFLGIVFALLLKTLVGKIGLGYMLNPGVQRRITGWSVDFLIIATIMAIQAVIVWDYFIPILVISLTCGILTLLIVVYLGRRIWSYNLERTVGIFGLTTGNAATGLLLVRIADPEFRTPVALELVVQALFAVPFVLSCMILMHAPIWWKWSIENVIMMYGGVLLLSLALLKILKLWSVRKF
jgi:ESS family glutamate:Na+ symporter